MKAVNALAHIFSAIFSPLLLGTYGVILVMLLSYLTYSPARARLIVVAVTFAATCLVPVMGIFFLSRVGAVKDAMLNNRTDRTMPYVLCTICYIGTGIYFAMIHAPIWLVMFMFGGAATLIVLTVVNRWWKISGHAAAMGGLTAMIFFLMMSGNGVYDLQPEFYGAVLMSGVVCTSRLILERHTLGQVAAGYLNGLVCVFLPAWIFS